LLSLETLGQLASGDPAVAPAGYTKSWLFLSHSDGEAAFIQQHVDAVFSKYSFYPEAEWGRYGYRPPEDHKILGAWRHPEGIAFAFLLDNPRMSSVQPTEQFVLQYAGAPEELIAFLEPIEKLKESLAKDQHQRAKESRLETRLNSAQQTKSLQGVLGLLALFTTAINGFSLYIRKLPPPNSVGQTALQFYSRCLFAIHIGALALLLSFIVICILFVWKYGLLLLRKL
jgi:hypothetical protein